MPRPSPGLQVETLKQSPISDPAVAYRDFIRSQSMEFTREPSAIHHLVSLAYNVAPHQYLRLFPGLPHRTKRGIRSKGRQLSDGSLDLIHGCCTTLNIYHGPYAFRGPPIAFHHLQMPQTFPTFAMQVSRAESAALNGWFLRAALCKSLDRKVHSMDSSVPVPSSTSLSSTSSSRLSLSAAFSSSSPGTPVHSR